MREVTIGDHRSRSQGSGLRLHRPARLAGRRSLLVDRLGAVVADELLAAHRPRVRAAEHGDGDRDRRSLAVDALRRQRRADRGGGRARRSPRSACRRCSFRIRSAWSPSTAASSISAALRPRTGKSHVVHCLDAYQYQRGLQTVRRSGSISTSLGGFVRRQAMLPVISDFLFDDAEAVRAGAVAAQRDARRLPRADRQRVRVRAAAISRPAGSRSSTSRPARRGRSRAAPTATSARARATLAGRRQSRWRKISDSTSSRSVWTRRRRHRAERVRRRAAAAEDQDLKRSELSERIRDTSLQFEICFSSLVRRLVKPFCLSLLALAAGRRAGADAAAQPATRDHQRRSRSDPLLVAHQQPAPCGSASTSTCG